MEIEMVDRSTELEEVVFQALAHSIRRTIIKIIGAAPAGVLYTELIVELGLSTGKLNYHLEQLEGLIVKNDDRRYVLSSLGKKALNQINGMENEFSDEDEKYLKIAGEAQRASIEPILKSFLILGIAASVLVLVVLLILVYVAITQGGVPAFIYVLLPAFLALNLGGLVILIRALKETPEWLRRLEHRFFAS
jgi:hypothetical protein